MRLPFAANTPRLAASLSLLPLLLALAACESDRGERQLPPEALNAPEPAVPAMEGRSVFLGDQLEVLVSLSRGGFGARGEGPGGRREGGAPGGRGGGGVRLGGGGHGRGSERGEYGGGGRPPGDRDFAGGPAANPTLHASTLPPMRLHLRLVNHGTQPLEVEVVDFNSELGNFVVLPAKIAVAPGESADAEPMTSRLGLGAAEISITIRLRADNHAEKQVLVLKASPTPEPPPAAPTEK